MYQKLKKSKITDWWVAKKNDKMAFVNFLSKKSLNGEFLIVGYYLNKNQKVLATSTNYIVRITKEGIITSQGSFYPFEEAHELYMQFLIKANQENTVIASYWDFVKDSSKIIANITKNDITQKDIIFDFTPDEKGVMLSGYSKELLSKVVITTFRKRFCTILGIPESVEADIYNSSFALESESKERIEQVKRIFDEKVDGEYISVSIGFD